MPPLVVLEGTPDTSPKLSRLLIALGVSLRVLRFERLLGGAAAGASLVISESQLSTLFSVSRGSLKDIASRCSSVLIYPFSGSPTGLEALAAITGAKVSVSESSSGNTVSYSVADSRDLCGPFSGLRVSARCESDRALRIGSANAWVKSIIAGDSGNLLSQFKSEGLNLFVASSSAILDVDSAYEKNLKVADCFSGLVPLLIFLRQSCADRFQTPKLWANWIIDDPNLRSRYGFLDMRALAPVVRETGMALSIAFIPWNYRRTSKGIVDQFRSAWPQLSLCVHGCDHTGAEFATRTSDEALQLIQLALSRMERFKAETSLPYAPVMVFPRGEFSREAMGALRISNILGAVNTELVDSRTGSGVKGGELLQPAITSFGGFPLFLRRRAEEPIENFALDLMLGKPCLVVTHHQYFESGLRPLREVVESLKRLEPEMEWKNLSSGISSTCSIARGAESGVRVQLYSSRTTVDLPDATVEFSKHEAVSPLQAFVDGEPVEIKDGFPVRFSVSRKKSQTVTVDVKSGTWPAGSEVRQSAKLRLKVAVRRYLSEVRDNYVDRYPAVKSRLVFIKRAVSH